MTVQVLLFAHLRDISGAGEISMELPPGSTIESLADRLAQRDIRFHGMLRYARPTLNAEWTTPEALLTEHDVVGFLPPSSGG
jgi:molybdopterin converting factor small subunit